MDHDMPMPMPGHGGGHHDEMQCSMSMVWNTSTRGMCVVFSRWKVTDSHSLVATLVALFLLAMLLEYLRLCIRSFDAHLITIHHLPNAFVSALGNNVTHRRKASVQQRRHPSQSGAVLSSGVNTAIGDRRLPQAEPSTGSWPIVDDDAPLLPGGNASRSPRRASIGIRLRNAFVSPLPIAKNQQLRRSVLYVSSVALSMFLMLVFMTYNAWLIGAVLAGAAFGHYLFSRDLGLGRLGEEKGMACH